MRFSVHSKPHSAPFSIPEGQLPVGKVFDFQPMCTRKPQGVSRTAGAAVKIANEPLRVFHHESVAIMEALWRIVCMQAVDPPCGKQDLLIKRAPFCGPVLLLPGVGHRALKLKPQLIPQGKHCACRPQVKAPAHAGQERGEARACGAANCGL